MNEHHSAGKYVVDSVRLIVNEFGLTRQQPEAIGFHNGCPQPCLGAHVTVALEGCLRSDQCSFSYY
jgi:hypothetical protein